MREHPYTTKRKPYLKNLFDGNRSGWFFLGLIQLRYRNIQNSIVVAGLDVVNVSIFRQRKSTPSNYEGQNICLLRDL